MLAAVQNLYQTNSERVSALIDKRYCELSTDLEKDFCDQLLHLYIHPEAFDSSAFEKTDLITVLKYLRITHHYYLNTRLPEIEQTINQLLFSDISSQKIKRIALFFTAYRLKLQHHIQKEEDGILKHIDETLSGLPFNLKIVEDFIKEHDDIDSILSYVNELLADIGMNKQISLISLLSAQIEMLMIDLYIHGKIEDEVFIQKVLNIE